MQRIKQFYRRHPIWSWVIVVFVGLIVLGAALSSPDDNDDDDNSAQEVKAKPKPKVVKITVKAPKEVTKPTAVIRGTVTPASAKVTVEGKRIKVANGRFRYQVKLTRGVNAREVAATAAGYDDDSETVSTYRNLTKAEMAEQKARQEAREEAARLAAEQRAEAAKQDFINSAETIPYAQLQKDPSAYIGHKVVYTGQIFQIQQQGNVGFMLLSVTNEGYDFWSDEVWVNYFQKVAGAEGDQLTVYGVVKGSKSFETQIGGERYVPEIRARYIEE